MIVRIEVQQHTSPDPYWQLKRCHVQIAGTTGEVAVPSQFLPMRFLTLEETVRHAKSLTFHHLTEKQHRAMPDQIDWRISDDAQVFPCPACQQPMYRKAKLGRTGTSLDLKDWGCPRCKKTVTLNTEGLC